MSKNSRHEKASSVAALEASESNVINNQEENVMSKNSTAASNVIPFDFGKKQVRAMMIDDQPWFVASDVALALMYSEAKDMTRNLDDDEKGRQIVPTLGGEQEMLVINESGLYSAILRSRKAEAKHFKKWVTAEVLPAIRKHGRYIDESGQMETIVGKAIGADGVRMLAALKRGKVANLPVEFRRRALAKMGQQLNTAFGVRQAADIPLEKLDAARNFIAAYAIEGEWLPREEKQNQQLDIHFPVDYLSGRRPGMQHPRNESTNYLNVSLLDLIEPFDSPCEAILSRLGKAGYNVDGAWWEIRTYRNKLGQLRNLLENFKCNFEGAQQYVIKRGIAA